MKKILCLCEHGSSRSLAVKKNIEAILNDETWTVDYGAVSECNGAHNILSSAQLDKERIDLIILETDSDAPFLFDERFGEEARQDLMKRKKLITVYCYDRGKTLADKIRMAVNDIQFLKMYN